MALAAFDLFGRVVAHGPAVRIGLDALAVQDGGGGLGASALGLADVRPQAGVERLPGVVEGPLAKDMIDGLPRRKAQGQQAPLDAAFDHIENGVPDPTPIHGRPSAFAALGEQAFEAGPLGVRKTRVEGGDFHRLNGAALKIERVLPGRAVNSFPHFSHRPETPPRSDPDPKFPPSSILRQTLKANCGFSSSKSAEFETAIAAAFAAHPEKNPFRDLGARQLARGLRCVAKRVAFHAVILPLVI